LLNAIEAGKSRLNKQLTKKEEERRKWKGKWKWKEKDAERCKQHSDEK